MSHETNMLRKDRAEAAGDSAAEYMDQRVLTGQIQLFQNHGFLIGDGFRRRVKIDLFSQHHLENRVFGRRQTGEDQGADHMLLRRHAGIFVKCRLKILLAGKCQMLGDFR